MSYRRDNDPATVVYSGKEWRQRQCVKQWNVFAESCEHRKIEKDTSDPLHPVYTQSCKLGNKCIYSKCQLWKERRNQVKE